MLCSFVKHLGSGRALKKGRKNTRLRLVFPLHFFRVYRFLCALQQSPGFFICYYNIDRTLRALRLVKNLCFISVYHSVIHCLGFFIC